jgi:AcrR family transcriptional regulator
LTEKPVSRAALHKENLVQTAMRLFRRQGFAATGLQQILAESGAPKGSLYHYFPGGKDELAVAAVELAGRLISEELGTLAKRTQTPEAFLAAYAVTLGRWMEEGGFTSGSPITTVLLECAPQNQAVTAVGRAAHDDWIRIISEVYRTAGLEPEEALERAELAIISFEGALVLARVRETAAPLHLVAKRLARLS